MNEPRCVGCPAGTVADWMTEMAAHVKSLDANHLVATGAEGFFGDAPNPGNPGSWAAGEGQVSSAASLSSRSRKQPTNEPITHRLLPK